MKYTEKQKEVALAATEYHKANGRYPTQKELSVILYITKDRVASRVRPLVLKGVIKKDLRGKITHVENILEDRSETNSFQDALAYWRWVSRPFIKNWS